MPNLDALQAAVSEARHRWWNERNSACGESCEQCNANIDVWQSAAEALGAAKERAACREAVEETWSYIDEDGERRYDGNIQCPDCLAAIDARGTP